MKIVFKKPSEVKVAPYNPATRTTNAAVKKLLESVKANGILLPLVMDKKGNLIDGHRRLKCAKTLRLKEVPVIEMDCVLEKDEAFETINSTSKKISNNEMIYIYLNGGTVPRKIYGLIKAIEDRIGRKNLEILGNDYVSCRVGDIAGRLMRYCKTDSEEMFVKTVMWLAKHKMSFHARAAMDYKVPKTTILNAIKKNQPLKRAYK